MVGYRTKVRQIPDCPIERKSVIMGSVWVFRPNHKYSFPGLCVSRMVIILIFILFCKNLIGFL
jgi:hypothetical protein